MENIVLDTNFNVKVIDFGLACPLSGPYGSGKINGLMFGTERYMAPEILRGCAY